MLCVAARTDTELLILLLVSYLELAVRCFVCGERFVWVQAVTFISLSFCPAAHTEIQTHITQTHITRTHITQTHITQTHITQTHIIQTHISNTVTHNTEERGSCLLHWSVPHLDSSWIIQFVIDVLLTRPREWYVKLIGGTSEWHDQEHDMGHVIWHDMTLWQHYWVVTSLQASKHWYWCCEIGSPGTILTLLLLSRILTLLRRRLQRISMFVRSHWTHIPLIVWVIASDMIWTGTKCWVIISHYHGSDIKTR